MSHHIHDDSIDIEDALEHDHLNSNWVELLSEKISKLIKNIKIILSQCAEWNLD